MDSVNYVGVTHVISTPDPTRINEAAACGKKIMIGFGNAFTPDAMMDCYKSNAAMKAWIDQYNISQYRNNPGLSAYYVCVACANCNLAIK